MTITSQLDPEKNFSKQWILICAIGFAIGGAVGVLGGGGTGYFLGNNLAVFLDIPPEMRQSMSDVLASFLMGVASGGITSFFQWLLLRKFLSNAKWWIVVGALGSSIGNAINNVVLSSGGISEQARFASILCFSLLIMVPLIGLFKGFLEWLVLRKTFQNSTRWIGVRAITNVVVVVISLVEFSIRTSLNLNVWGYVLTLFAAGLIEGVIFGAITGYLLADFFERKSETLLLQVQ
jgi:hypothetical protein